MAKKPKPMIKTTEKRIMALYKANLINTLDALDYLKRLNDIAVQASIISHVKRLYFARMSKVYDQD